MSDSVHAPTPAPRRRVRSIALLGVLAVVAASCGTSQRPAADAWLPTWDGVKALIPPAAELTPPRNERCQDVLADLRSARGELRPGPDELVDAAVSDWIGYAEHTFFTCFDGIDVDMAYRTLARYEGEVDAAVGRPG